MSDLAEKIRKSRRLEISVGKMKFFGRRPSVAEFFKMFTDGEQDVEVVKKYIDDWENVCPNDFFDGAGAENIPFDRDFFNEGISDKPEIWKAIIDQIIQKTRGYIKTEEDNKKNFKGGSSKAS